jgi:branched-chain amino acid transport system ATP-binding protein
MAMSVLKVQGLGKAFGGVSAVENVSFTLSSGEMLALIGPNGAGKSTTFNLINGQMRADQGQIILNSQNLVGMSPREICRQGVGRTFQIAETFSSLSVIENVQIALLSFANKFFSFFKTAASFQRSDAMCLLTQVGLEDQADRAVSELAYGDVKRVELALALATQPGLLLMDEPTAGMAPAERQALMTLTKKLVLERQIAVLFTEHSMDVVFGYADRVILLAQGRVIAQGTPEEIRRDPYAQRLYFGSGATFGDCNAEG